MVRSLWAMMHDCAVCGTVKPSLRQFHRWEFDDGRSVYGVAFQLFERCVCRHTLGFRAERLLPVHQAAAAVRSCTQFMSALVISHES